MSLSPIDLAKQAAKNLLFTIDKNPEKALIIILEKMPANAAYLFPDEYQPIFQAYYEIGTNKDTATLLQHIKERNSEAIYQQADKVLQEALLNKDKNAIPLAYQCDKDAIQSWCKQVIDGYQHDKAAKAMQKYAKYRINENPGQALGKLISDLMNIHTVGQSGKIQFMPEITQQTIENLQAEFQAMAEGLSYPNSLPFISDVLRPFSFMPKRELTLVVSWPGNGKSALIEQELFHQARLCRKAGSGCVVICSVENSSKYVILEKEASRQTGLDISAKEMWTQGDKKQFLAKIAEFENLPILIEHRKSEATPSNVAALCRIGQAKYGHVEMIALDPLNYLLSEQGNYEASNQKIIEWMTMLDEFNAAIVLAHHANKIDKNDKSFNPLKINNSYIQNGGEQPAFQILWVFALMQLWPFLSDEAKVYFLAERDENDNILDDNGNILNMNDNNAIQDMAKTITINHADNRGVIIRTKMRRGKAYIEHPTKFYGERLRWTDKNLEIKQEGVNF